MGLTIPVILNSVNNLSDARYAAGMGVDLMGFEVEIAAERYINPDLYKAITAWLSGVKTVAEIAVLTPATLAIIQEHYQPDLIQFEKAEGISIELLSKITFIQKITAEKGAELDLLQHLESLILNPATFILLELSDWKDWTNHPEEILKVNHSFPVLWALPVEKEDALQIQNMELKGLALKGGDEQRPGWKDLDQLIDILEALEEN
jgi:phosphoribosylanthranilate isomerase